GWYELAPLIRPHMYYSKEDGDDSITELDLLCLSDRMVKEDEYVGLRKRMSYVLEKFQGNPQAQERIRTRLSEARRLKHRIEGLVGSTVEELMAGPLPELDGEEAEEEKERTLCLVRHGQIRQHEGPIFLGQTDVPLSDLGREQARQAAESLKRIPLESPFLCCSDLSRARETAEIIGEALGLPIFLEEPGFREMALGDWDGRLVADVRREEPEEYERRGREFLTYKRSVGSENFYDLSYRASKALDRLMKQVEGDLILVAHGGTIKMLTAHLLGMPPERFLKEKIGNGQILVIKMQRGKGVLLPDQEESE
ncbi:MAG: histidine phosphatase family protein, partial [Bacillota bacterium]|nr:histidine phosphatase family protein [Bacillota bacterium]